MEVDFAEELGSELAIEFYPNRKDTKMANGAGQQYDPNMYEKAQAGGVGIVKETPFTRLSGAVERLRKAETLTNEACTKLCGEQVNSEGSDAKVDHPSGLLGVLDSLTDDVTYLADLIIDHARRLNGRL